MPATRRSKGIIKSVARRKLEFRDANPGFTPGVDRYPIEVVLSDTEYAVFLYFGRGLTTRDIAAKLKRSPKTIETHREHIKFKLNYENVNQLTVAAAQHVSNREPSPC